MNRATTWIIAGISILQHLSFAQMNSPVWDKKNYPIEDVPPLTEELKQRIESRVPLTARVARDGATYRLMVNDEYVPAMGMQNKFEAHDKLYINTMREVGSPVIVVKINVAMYPARFGYYAPTLYGKCFWDGKNKYDTSQIDSVFWRVLRCYPDAKIIVAPDLDVYPEWCDENTNEIMRNQDGVPFIVGTHFVRVGNDPKTKPGQVEHYEQSPYSEVYLSDVSAAIVQLMKEIHARAFGNAVIGYFMQGGQDAQLYNFQTPSFVRLGKPEYWGDYSSSAKKEFRKWLSRKYTDIASLNSAWRSSYASFDVIEPPSAESMIGTSLFRSSERQREMDWHRFTATARNFVIERVAAAIKKHAPRPMIVGVYGGESGARSDLTANYPLLQSKNIDFFNHQVRYGIRLPPNIGGINAILGSYQLNGKLFFADTDHRTYAGLSNLDLNENATKGVAHIAVSVAAVGQSRNIEELRAMWRRDIGRLWSEGAGSMIQAIRAPWEYELPEIRAELKKIFETSYRTITHDPALPELAVIYDEKAVDCLEQGLALLHNWWANKQMRELEASGVPCRVFYMEDFIAGKIPEHKAYLFLNALSVEGGMSAAVKKLKGNGHTLIFLQGVGYNSPELTVDDIKNITGMGLVPFDSAPKMKKAPEAHTLTVGIDFNGNRTTSYLREYRYNSAEYNRDLEPAGTFTPGYMLHSFGAAALAVDDADAMVVAAYAGTEKAAMAIRDYGSWKSVFIGAYIIPRTLVNNIATYTGVWRLTDTNVVAAMNGSMLMVHSLNDGDVTVHLKKSYALKEVAPGTIVREAAAEHVLPGKAGYTYLFELKGK